MSPNINPEYVISLQGQEYCTYRGVLDRAHALGLEGIRTRILQVPGPDNEYVAIVEAEIRMQDGRVFVDVADASPKNVASRLASALIRMASTRAKGRALRDAVNIGEALAEELDMDAEHAAPRADSVRSMRPPSRPVMASGRGSAPARESAPAADSPPATPVVADEGPPARDGAASVSAMAERSAPRAGVAPTPVAAEAPIARASVPAVPAAARDSVGHVRDGDGPDPFAPAGPDAVPAGESEAAGPWAGQSRPAALQRPGAGQPPPGMPAAGAPPRQRPAGMGSPREAPGAAAGPPAPRDEGAPPPRRPVGAPPVAPPARPASDQEARARSGGENAVPASPPIAPSVGAPAPRLAASRAEPPEEPAVAAARPVEAPRAQPAAPAREPEEASPDGGGAPAMAGGASAVAGGAALGDAQPAALVCGGPECGRSITQGQYNHSMHTFGAPFCPACQRKQQARGKAS